MKQSRSPKQGTHGVLVRMPVDLHRQLREIAEAETRTVNYQIIHALRLHVEAMKEAA